MIDCDNSFDQTREVPRVSSAQRAETTHVTELLGDWQGGDKHALDQLMPLVYRELRRLAAGYLRTERDNHTLQPTALIHESYLRLVRQDLPRLKNREHFFAVAARLMRQILVDHARAKRASKRGGRQIIVQLDNVFPSTFCYDGDRVLSLDAAITKLATLDQRKSKVLEMRLFGGMEFCEIAKALEVSEPTVKRDMRMARAWLRVEVGK